MKLIIAISIAAVILLLIFVQSNKFYGERVYTDYPSFSIEDMAKDSDIIVLGVVESIDDLNYNIYMANIKIEEEFTDSYNDTYVIVRAYNADKYVNEVSLEEGERVLLFLKDFYDEGYYQVPYGAQGKFIIKDGKAYNNLNVYDEDEIIKIIKEYLNR
ncbi:MAG: hypothetical protein KatS3mg003_0771 [Candidatus Nitrosocaldaceae archaeon]|nr:MAG: hypothetical protein KatS3mg003_0771 [Candidatus Nitrosocaldaceae archaeon]